MILAPAGALVTCAENATFVITKPVLINVRNLTINLNGSTLKMSGANVGSTNFSVHAANFTCFGGSISAGDVCFRVFADGAALYEITAPDDVIATFILTDIGGTNAVVHDCSVGYTSSETFYLTANGAKFTNVDAAGSRGQDCLRVDKDSQGVIPQNITVTNCAIDQRGNKQNNEGASVRAGKHISFIGCTFQTYSRCGQINTPGARPGDNTVVTYDSCNWPNTKFGFNHIQTAQGVVLTAVSNMFLVDSDQVPISMPANVSSATLTGNTMIRKVSGMATKGKLYSPMPNALVVETGTQTIDCPAAS